MLVVVDRLKDLRLRTQHLVSQHLIFRPADATTAHVEGSNWLHVNIVRMSSMDQRLSVPMLFQKILVFTMDTLLCARNANLTEKTWTEVH